MYKVLLTFLKLVNVECNESSFEVFTHSTGALLFVLFVFCLQQIYISLLTCSLESDFPALIGDSNFVVSLLDGGVELVNDIQWLPFDFKSHACGQELLFRDIFELMFVKPFVIEVYLVISSSRSSALSNLICHNLLVFCCIIITLAVRFELLPSGHLSFHPWMVEHLCQRGPCSRVFFHS